MSAGSRMMTFRPCDSSEGARSPVVVMKTTSGWKETIFSGLALKPPTFGRAFAAAGKSEKSSTATRRSPAPIAKRISVADGATVTMRFGEAVSVTLLPRSSVTVSGKRDVALGVATAAVLVAGAAAPQAETTERKAMRRIAKNAGRRVIRGTPFSRRRVGREREARRPEFYGRGTLPESH